jgi:hypothetical protein
MVPRSRANYSPALELIHRPPGDNDQKNRHQRPVTQKGDGRTADAPPNVW